MMPSQQPHLQLQSQPQAEPLCQADVPDAQQKQQTERTLDLANPARIATLHTLLATSGQRHTWTFPANITVKAVKEIIFNEWRQEWPERPPHAASLRLLHLGHFLDDRVALDDVPNVATTLSSSPSTQVAATVVHLVIRPNWSNATDGADDESLLKSSAAGSSGVGGCRCIIC
ncbi:hypothetical protein K437DRAFT_42539 [Tilletiaria anomala UBC 951]|uniref:UBL3-like ubiquitin domain-containing protein n=1 Tax=Tilletiaria anomala (strain ATCC 24038 / CBS 436.72 / UBC 951) TaxID=1037660 RepID=A0A066V671_TILAU|nr:uncharacterized protein K437DRAFT_42539 [Tilletiaria anomala UBC 951]KDN37247.1 hypothetical protein K437DRAFT_42539 [Tilletiaria anomala UBC 951]